MSKSTLVIKPSEEVKNILSLDNLIDTLMKKTIYVTDFNNYSSNSYNLISLKFEPNEEVELFGNVKVQSIKLKIDDVYTLYIELSSIAREENSFIPVIKNGQHFAIYLIENTMMLKQKFLLDYMLIQQYKSLNEQLSEVKMFLTEIISKNTRLSYFKDLVCDL